MALNLNKAVIAGNVGTDPEIRTTQAGKKVANFSVATNESYKDKQTGEKIENTEWHRVVVWGPLVEKVIEPYVSKGSPVYIVGKIKTRKWQDNEGNDKYTTEIIVSGNQCEFQLNGRHEGTSQGQVQEDQGGNYPDEDEDEIPF